MRELTAILHHGEPNEGGFWATCLEVPGANGQGESRKECLKNLTEAVHLMVQTEREAALKNDPSAQEIPLSV